METIFQLNINKNRSAVLKEIMFANFFSSYFKTHICHVICHMMTNVEPVMRFLEILGKKCLHYIFPILMEEK